MWLKFFYNTVAASEELTAVSITFYKCIIAEFSISFIRLAYLSGIMPESKMYFARKL